MKYNDKMQKNAILKLTIWCENIVIGLAEVSRKKCAHFSSGLQLLSTHGVFSITKKHKRIIKKVLAIAQKNVFILQVVLFRLKMDNSYTCNTKGF